MNASEILKILTEIGVVTRADGDELVLTPGSDVPADLVPAIRACKTEMLSRLRENRAVSERPETRVDAFTPWALAEWRRVSIPDWRRILTESIQKGDARREAYARWMLREVLLDPEYEDEKP